MQVETDETENWNGTQKAGTESGNRKAGNWKWSSELKIISGDSSLGLWTSYV